MHNMMRRVEFLAAAGAVVALPRPAGAQAPIRLAVATAAIDSGLPPVVAQRGGFFEREGLDVDVQSLASGAAIAAAVAGGSLQIGASSLIGLITAHTKGVPFQIVSPGSIYLSDKPTTALLVKTDAPYKSGADLNGKTIASPAIGDMQSISTFAWIDKNGGNSGSVKHVELAPAAVMAALEAGRIEAATLTEPRLSAAVRGGSVRVLAKVYDAIAPRFLVSCEVAMADYIAANRNVVERYARAERQARIFANAHQDQTAQWLSQFAKIDVDAIGRSRREIFEEDLALNDIQVVIDAAARYKVIERPFNARDMVSPVVLNLR
jgi:NitT/TauT family transport system substrate-binding protein